MLWIVGQWQAGGVWSGLQTENTECLLLYGKQNDNTERASKLFENVI